MNFARRKLRCYLLQWAKNNGTDKTAQIRRLICAFLVRKTTTSVFLALNKALNEPVQKMLRIITYYVRKAVLEMETDTVKPA